MMAHSQPDEWSILYPLCCKKTIYLQNLEGLADILGYLPYPHRLALYSFPSALNAVRERYTQV